MKILVISRVAWNGSTNFGNTYSSLFKNMGNVKIAHIYFGDGLPDTNVANRFYRVSEHDLLLRILGKSKECGKEVFCKKGVLNKTNILKKFSHNHRFTTLFVVRDLLWASNVWRTKELSSFITSFAPDIIFAPLYNSIYMNKIEQYIYNIAKVPMVSFVSDDVYSLKQFHFSPFYWLYRFSARKNIRKTLKNSSILYTISKAQNDEYKKTLHNNCKILFKGDHFTDKPNVSVVVKPIKIVYTGNLSCGRWKTISALAQSIRKINSKEKIFELEIYSLTALTSKMKKAIEIPNASVFKGAVSGDKISAIQGDTDILLHCESFNLKDRLEVRMSFSTKIVDYFKRGKCIVAIGPEDVASIRYLRDNHAAIVASSTDEIDNLLRDIADNPEIINEYAVSAWECGAHNHCHAIITDGLHKDLLNIVKEVQCESATN